MVPNIHIWARKFLQSNKSNQSSLPDTRDFASNWHSKTLIGLSRAGILCSIVEPIVKFPMQYNM